MGLPSRKACCQPLRETIAEASIAHCAETRYPTCSVQRSDCFAFCGLQGPQDISHCSRHRYASAPPFHTTTFLLPVDEDDQHTPYYRPDLSGPAGVRPCRQTSCTTLSRHTHLVKARRSSSDAFAWLTRTACPSFTLRLDQRGEPA